MSRNIPVDLGEFEFIDKYGMIKTVESNSITIPYKNDNAILSIIRDITEKKMIEQQFLREKQFSENLLKSLPGIFFVVEIKDKKPLLIKWNENFRKESLLTEKELYRMNVLDFFKDEAEREFTIKNIERILEGEFDVITTIQNPTLKDGSVQRYFYQAIGFQENGKTYYMGTGINISDKRDLERKLIESVIQTEESERRRIASDLHDGLGPELSSVKLYAQGLIEASDNKEKEIIGDKLLKLIDLAVEKISEISFNISPHILLKYGLTEAVKSFITKLQIQSRSEIITRFDEIKRFGINQELTLYRTIKELFHNSLRYSGAGQINLRIKTDDEKIYVFYADNGIGFHVSDELEKRKGMGLFSMKSRIQSLDGSFTLKSKPGKGMSATIILPYLSKNE